MRRLFTLAAAVSLLLCLITVVLWVRSLFVGWNFRLEGVNFGTTRWGIWIGKIKGPIMGWEPVIDPPVYFGGLFRYLNRPNYIRIFIPYWPVALVLAILPLFGLIGEFRRRRKRRDGCCHVCHYDLTGNTSGVCPECGTGVAGKAGA